MPKITACIISFNEEKKIEECLKSVRPIVDEIIVVDSNSSDKTVEIAKKYAERVYLQDFLGHVEQKNLAVSKATNEWVLALDCDERLSPELQQSILRVKDHLEKFDAYRVSRKTFYVYRWLNHVWRPDKKVRLFNKNRARWDGVNPHDAVFVDSDLIQDLTGDLLHLSFDSLSAHLQTIDSFTEIGAREIMKKGKRVSLFTPFLHANWTFARMYILKLGFLDGFAGLAASLLSWVHVFVKYSKVITWRRKGADH